MMTDRLSVMAGVAGAGILSLACAAHGSVIDFTGVPNASGQSTVTVDDSEGNSFTFTAAPGPNGMDIDSNGPTGSQDINASNNNNEYSFGLTSGGVFGLNSIQLINETFNNVTDELQVTFADTTQQTLTAQNGSQQSTTLTPNLSNVVNVKVVDNSTEQRTGLDNIDVTVPEPASLALMGVGGLLMLPRRRRSASC